MITISALKEHVTHFSEEIRFRTSPADQVKVAGKVTEVLTLDEQYHLMILDDFVGTTRVILSNEMMNHFSQSLQIGKFVSVEGFVNVVTRKFGGKTERQHSVVAFDLIPLT